MRLVPVIAFFSGLISATVCAQNVGINATGAVPHASALLDIDAAGMTVKGGLLIPRLTTAERNAIAAPATSLLIYNGSNARYEYFDGLAWVPFTGGGTLDQAYDFGGAGAGRTVTADAGAVTIAGTDGLVSTGVQGSGTLAPAGAGARMVWNPRKVAFRAGLITGAGTNWDDVNVGNISTAFGMDTRASGGASMAWGTSTLATGQSSTAWGSGTQATSQSSTAWGFGTQATGQASTAWGNGTQATNQWSTAWGFTSQATGLYGTAWGLNTRATGIGSTAWGVSSGASVTEASGSGSTAIGTGAEALSYCETAIGMNNTVYTPASTTIPASSDRLFVIGNGFTAGSRSDALVVLKNGHVGMGTSTPQDRLHLVGSFRMVDGNQAAGRVLVSDANGTGSWAAPNTFASGTLDQAYDFGGAGSGRTITADAGAVTIAGADGFVSTGSIGSGALTPAGAGTRMVWNPRKGAFRAGTANLTNWDDVNMGQGSFAAGTSTRALGMHSTALGQLTNADGLSSFTAGQVNTATGSFSVALNFSNTALGQASTSMGSGNTAHSYGETVLGIGATNYTTSVNGTTEFRAGNTADRLLVVGNAIDANNNTVVDAAERSDALVILKNGNTGIGVSSPTHRLHVAGQSLFHNGFSADNAALLYRSNTDYMFLGPQSGSSANGAAIALFGSTNASSGNPNGMDVNVPNGRVRFNHAGGQFEFRTNSTSSYTGFWELNDQELRMGHNSTGRAIVIANGFGERFRIDPNGNVGINTGVAAARLHVQGNVRIADGTQAAGRVFVSDVNGTGSWQALTAGSLGGWNLTGNAGTIPGTSFLGTTDNQPLVLRTNNAERLRVVGTGEVGIGTAAPGTRLHVNGGISASPITATANAQPFNYAPGDRTYVRMGSNNTPLNRLVVLDAGLAAGQILIVECTAAGTNGIAFNDGALQNAGGSKQLLNEDSITFVWNGSKWILISFADN